MSHLTIQLEELLTHSWSLYESNAGRDLGGRLKDAFHAVPRHLFIPRFKEWGDSHIQEVNEENLSRHLLALYSDRSIVVVAGEGESDYTMASTPSIVFTMLKMLDLKDGERVCEVGAGSGYNAALMAHLVGERGHVDSFEVRKAVAEQTRGILARYHFSNVTVHAQDVAELKAGGKEFDKIIYTCGAHDIPPSLLGALKDGGRMVFVFRSAGNPVSSLVVLEKRGETLHSSESRFSLFMEDTGIAQIADLEPCSRDQFNEMEVVDRRELRLFQSGVFGVSGALQGYLSFAYPHRYRGVSGPGHDPKEAPFVLWSDDGRGAVVSEGVRITTYGDIGALHEFLDLVKEWFSKGTPLLWDMKLTVYSGAGRRDVALKEGEYLLHRPFCTFVLSPREGN